MKSRSPQPRSFPNIAVHRPHSAVSSVSMTASVIEPADISITLLGYGHGRFKTHCISLDNEFDLDDHK